MAKTGDSEDFGTLILRRRKVAEALVHAGRHALYIQKTAGRHVNSGDGRAAWKGAL